ncbi:uncharacterized protein LOC111088798 [Limulus polyphemus]|uniref:Uncharacterized protein LOC111088798 n=1 Tax=Limulus polyphemus TaxID=6850 RepID=A0ABM1TI17_LIMPO|nr:uncharacterized protein LOC111088798 [Limulus polyphemus]
MKRIQILIFLMIFVGQVQLQRSHIADRPENITNNSEEKETILNDKVGDRKDGLSILEKAAANIARTLISKTKQSYGLVRPYNSKNNTREYKSGQNLTDLKGSETRGKNDLAVSRFLEKQTDILEHRRIVHNNNKSMLVIGIPIEALTVLKSAAEDHVKKIGIPEDYIQTEETLGKEVKPESPTFFEETKHTRFHANNQGAFGGKKSNSQARLNQKEVLILSYDKPDDLKTANEKNQQPVTIHQNLRNDLKYAEGQGSHISSFHDIASGLQNPNKLVTPNAPNPQKDFQNFSPSVNKGHTYTQNSNEQHQIVSNQGNRNSPDYVQNNKFGRNYQGGLPSTGLKSVKQHKNHELGSYEHSGYPQASTAPIYQKPNVFIPPGIGKGIYNNRGQKHFKGTFSEFGGHANVPFGLPRSRYKPIVSVTNYGHKYPKHIVIKKPKYTGGYPSISVGRPNYLSITGPSLNPLRGNAGYHIEDDDPFTGLGGLGLGLGSLGAFGSLGGINKGIGLTSGFGLSKGLTLTFSAGGKKKGYGHNKGHGGTVAIYKGLPAPYTPPAYRKAFSHDPHEGRVNHYSSSTSISHIEPHLKKVPNLKDTNMPKIHNNGYGGAKSVLQSPKQAYNSGQLPKGTFSDAKPVSKGPDRKYFADQPVPQGFNGVYHNSQPAPPDSTIRYDGGQPVPQGSNVVYNGGQLVSQDTSGRYNGGQPVPQGSSGGYNGGQPITQGSNVVHNGGQPISQGTGGRYNGGQSVSQGTSGRYNGGQPVPQGSSGGYNGGQSVSQGSSGGYNGGQPVPQGSSGWYNGGQTVPQGSSGGYNGGQTVPQGSSGGYNGGQTVPQGSSGGYNGGQPVHQGTSGGFNNDQSVTQGTIGGQQTLHGSVGERGDTRQGSSGRYTSDQLAPQRFNNENSGGQLSLHSNGVRQQVSRGYSG